MVIWQVIILSSFLGVLTDTSKTKFVSDTLRINQIQMLGSHNSYRIKTYEPLWDEMNRLKHPMSKSFVVRSWNYTHQPLDTQFSVYGLRSVELDIYHDPLGGRFYYQKGKKKINEDPESNNEDLKKPGLKVMHVPDYDYQTHHYLFTDALEAIKKWSDDHPDHEPLFVMVEMKELQFMKFFYPFRYTRTLKFTEAAVDSIDLEIESVFGKTSSKIFMPDSLRKKEKTIRDAIQKNGWPTLREAKGKIFFILMGSKSGEENYLKNHPHLESRKMFIFTDEKNVNAAFIKIGNPQKHEKEIRKLVEKGFMVRTRSDAGTREARREDYSRMEVAFGSGAQIISTDFYAGDKCFLDKKECSDFKVAMPGGIVCRVNPLFNETKK